MPIIIDTDIPMAKGWGFSERLRYAFENMEIGHSVFLKRKGSSYYFDGIHHGADGIKVSISQSAKKANIKYKSREEHGLGRRIWRTA